MTKSYNSNVSPDSHQTTEFGAHLTRIHFRATCFGLIVLVQFGIRRTNSGWTTRCEFGRAAILSGLLSENTPLHVCQDP